MSPPKDKPILCVDFDGVIHDYKHGWQGGRLYGHVTTGFFYWLDLVLPLFRVVIYSSRSKEPDGVDKMREWLVVEHAGKPLPDGIEFAHEKPPAYLTIDDRCLTFNGDWAEFMPQKLLDFKPWMMK